MAVPDADNANRASPQQSVPDAPSSTNVEMTTIDRTPALGEGNRGSEGERAKGVKTQIETAASSTDPPKAAELSQPAQTTASSTSTEPMARRNFTPVGISAVGQSEPAPEAEMPKVGITLLMPTGHRSEWRFDQKYLEKRNVNVPDDNPFKISVYTLKELMLREWRTEWGPKPSSPSAIRLITLGKLLDDKASLEDCKFTTQALTILHMTVKPQDIMDEEDAKIAKNAGGREGEGRSRRLRCACVIL